MQGGSHDPTGDSGDGPYDSDATLGQCTRAICAEAAEFE